MDPGSRVNLASRLLGASVVAASDEFFGEKENLLRPEPPGHHPRTFGHKGQLVDGWETRRRREPGHDYALVRLGAPAPVRAVRPPELAADRRGGHRPGRRRRPGPRPGPRRLSAPANAPP
jgi:hypothetical protein